MIILDVAVHTPNLYDFIELVKFAFSNDVYWVSGSAFINGIDWEIYGCNSCVFIGEHGLQYGDIDFYKELNIDVLSVDEFYRISNPLKDFK